MLRWKTFWQLARENTDRRLFVYAAEHTLAIGGLRVPQDPRTFFYLLPNMLLVVTGIECLYAGFRGQRHLPYEVVALQVFAGLAFAASLFASAYERQFRPIVPLLMPGIAVVLARVVRIEVRA